MASGRVTKQDVASGDAAAVTRRRLIEAAVACILEKGYYRASSNEIARRAGVSWGVIQYHFRTRERLMLAAFEDACQTLIDKARNARIEGGTTGERLAAYFDLLVDYYGRQEYLAYLEINLNLVRDPDTSAETMVALTHLKEELRRHEFFPPGVDPRHRSLVFESLRGLIMSHLLRTDATVTPAHDDDASFRARADELVRALAAHIDADHRS